MSDPIFDFPAGWQVFAATDPGQHHEKCSYRTTDRALICDCAAMHAAGAAWDLALERTRTPETYVAEERACETCKEAPVPEPKPEFRFEMRALEVLTVIVAGEKSSLVNPTSERPVTVIAPDQKTAYDIAAEALGSHSRWAFEVVSVTDHRIPVQEPS